MSNTVDPGNAGLCSDRMVFPFEPGLAFVFKGVIFL